MAQQRVLVALVDRSRRFALPVFIVGLLIMIGGAWFAMHRLGVTTDTDRMFAKTLPWRQREIAMEAAFPQFQQQLVAVIDARIPEEADATAAALAKALAGDPAHFTSVVRPDEAPYLNQEGLLFLDVPALTALLNETIDAQPFLGQLNADPSARGLFSALSLMAMGVSTGQANLKPYEPALHAFDQALAAAAAGHAQPLSWENLLAGSLAQQQGKYRFVIAHPRLDYNALEPGGAAEAALKKIAANLEFVRAGQARVRVTGDVALADEEFASVAEGIVAGTVGSIVLITLWLFLAVKSWRLIVPILLTLILGLILTTDFAAAFVGTLNLISVAFAILFVGIAVDFAIQFSVRYREVRYFFGPRIGRDARALPETARRVARQILVAAAATAAGFLAFVPTDFSGVAQLGLIAGAGMIIAFFCTLIYLPALITLTRPRGERQDIGFATGGLLDPAMARARRPILGAFALLAVLGIVLLPNLTFDSDPLHTKNPNSEAMQTLRDLMNDPLTSPYSIDILVPSLADTGPLAKRLKTLPAVADVLDLNSLVPEDQKPKLALVADAAGILGPTLAAPPQMAPVSPDQIRMAIGAALGQIKPALAKLPPNHPLAAIAADLEKLQKASGAALMAMNAALTRFLPMQLQNLRTSLSAKPVTAADVPPSLKRDWLLPDGRARVQALPHVQNLKGRGLHNFVREVQGIAPNAGGSAVVIVATAQTIIDAFSQAMGSAFLAIAVILLLTLRRVLDAAMVLSALLLSALMTVVVVVLLPMKLNFANIIALPLLLGVGVSFNIYFVMNWRAGVRGFLGTATARAVVFSALTTGTAFGSLALSAHPGTASMGDLLLLSLACTLVATLLYLPALLAGLNPAGRRLRQSGTAPPLSR